MHASSHLPFSAFMQSIILCLGNGSTQSGQDFPPQSTQSRECPTHRNTQSPISKVIHSVQLEIGTHHQGMGRWPERLGIKTQFLHE